MTPAEDMDVATKTERPRKLNRLGIGALVVIQIAIVAGILLGLNFFAIEHPVRWDLTREAAYTLSPATRQYLAGDAIKTRKEPIKWIIAMRRSSPFYERIRALSEEYERFSNGKIDVEMLDPLRSPDRTQEVLAAYGMLLVKDMIIFDAREDDVPALEESDQGTKTLNKNIKLAIAEEFVSYTTADGVRKISGFRGEDVMTARLVEAIEGRPKRMLFLADKSQLNSTDENSPAKSLESTLLFQNIELIPAALSEMKEVPEDIEGIALIAPKYDLTETEVEVLKRYWNRPQSALLVLLRAGDTPMRLRAFLRENGVTPRRDRVVRKTDDALETRARGFFLPGMAFTQDLAGQSTILEGATSSLEVREGAEDLLRVKIQPVSLIQAAPDFWGETQFGKGNEAFDESEDMPPPLFLAACVVRGAANDDRLAAKTSRMIVMANTDVLDANKQGAENVDFLNSSVNWLINREALSGIGPRSLGTYRLPLLDAQISFINRVNLIFLPGFFILCGAMVWASRRV